MSSDPQARPGEISAAQLKAFIERIEKLHDERKALSEDIAAIYAEVKANGYVVKAVKTIVRLRAQDPKERENDAAVLKTYVRALGYLDLDIPVMGESGSDNEWAADYEPHSKAA